MLAKEYVSLHPMLDDFEGVNAPIPSDTETHAERIDHLSHSIPPAGLFSLRRRHHLKGCTCINVGQERVWHLYSGRIGKGMSNLRSDAYPSCRSAAHGATEVQDWIAIVAEAANARLSSAAAVVGEAETSRAANSDPSLPLDAYTGIYRDPWYGGVSISRDDDDVLWFRSARSEKLVGPLEHFQYDTFIARWTTRNLNADAYVSFTLTPAGTVERIRMKAVSPATDFSFDFHDLDLVRVSD
jgi:hypothetical protein